VFGKSKKGLSIIQNISVPRYPRIVVSNERLSPLSRG
jgi:hypothetical protein